jgi:hypothetical protein
VLVVILSVALGLTAAGTDLRLGGRVEASGTAYAAASANVLLDAFAGLGDLEAVTRTEFSVFPYTVGSETLAVYLVREWLSVGAEYEFGVLPLGITSATLVALALPPPWTGAMGDTVFEVSVDGEARLVGYTFATAPLRAEVWTRATVSASRGLGWLDLLLLGISLETTLSAPGDGRIWPVATAVAEFSLGYASLRSETTLALAPSIRLEEERVSVRASWSDLGVSAEGGLVLGAKPEGVTVEFRIAYEFGDAPLHGTSSDPGCAGGVCR